MFVQPSVQILARQAERRQSARSSVKVFPGARQRAAGGAGGAADHLHPPGDGKQVKRQQLLYIWLHRCVHPSNNLIIMEYSQNLRVTNIPKGISNTDQWSLYLSKVYSLSDLK